jgi:sodium transport system permease protein
MNGAAAMKHNKIIAIMQKEFIRFFSDRRLVLMSLVFPGLMIYAAYSFGGRVLANSFAVDADYTPTVIALNLPASIRAAAEDAGLPLTEAGPDVRAGAGAALLDRIQAKDLDIFIRFPENFDAAVAAYDPRSGLPAPAVEIYFNSLAKTSLDTYSKIRGLLDAYESGIANKFDVNPGEAVFDLAGEGALTGYLLVSLVPMLLVLFMVTGSLTLTTESIAGEKERGAIAALLITPMRRGELAAGKILSLGGLSFLCGLSSILGTMLALPALLSGSLDGETLDMSYLGPETYLLLVLIALSVVFLLTTILSLISASAKTVKEAQATGMPLLILVMLVGMTPLAGGGAQQEWYLYLIPVYNAVQCLAGVLGGEFSALNLVIAVAVNGLLACLGGWVLARMFGSEKVMFAR